MSIFIPIITILLFGIGCLGTLVPGLPGIGLVYGGILLYAFADGFTSISVSTVVYLGIVTIIAAMAQYVGSLWAAKSAGGRQKALIGTLLGAFIGTISGPIGIFVGAFMGALIGATIEGKNPEKAFRVAMLSVLGIVGGSLIQLVLSIALISAFVLAVFL
ncbi:MAG TPA: DUF456 domain-containing protein [Candidatus Andersenbacteria bacterium]|nr:DUF456 domain-containing protein [Candidatus Andersenbacteria bacterium]